MPKQLEFRTIEEFKRHYLPAQHEKEEMEIMMKNPELFGKYLVDKALETAMKRLSLL